MKRKEKKKQRREKGLLLIGINKVNAEGRGEDNQHHHLYVTFLLWIYSFVQKSLSSLSLLLFSFLILRFH